MPLGRGSLGSTHRNHQNESVNADERPPRHATCHQCGSAGGHVRDAPTRRLPSRPHGPHRCELDCASLGLRPCRPGFHGIQSVSRECEDEISALPTGVPVSSDGLPERVGRSKGLARVGPHAPLLKSLNLPFRSLVEYANHRSLVRGGDEAFQTHDTLDAAEVHQVISLLECLGKDWVYLFVQVGKPQFSS